ncbi:putative aminoacyltransferase, E1 ubiquitin-activating enzyme [Rosa chinensis]|uniref:RING-type E3 ubiquitin transferase n=1 Tax=Rosa chinensis TaxID=74649 RepID=A0A2P6PZI1_ROSCH|nr:U-box domain-containing protein 15 [Rosa chinensis]PRQ27347.1 putative aminoacyltransferase, E1 ubiquitin-activating enzyme [Rosa chinensis]
MVMDGEREGCEGEGCGEETAEGLIQSLESVIQSAARLGEYRRTQRKECYNLLRRMKLLLPLFEEVRELEGPVPESVVVWMVDLKKVLVMAKKLLKFCHEDSKIYLAIESDAVMVRFHAVHDKLTLALDSVPDELGISDEIREQIDLMVRQLKRARKRTDTQDIELAMDIMVVLEKKDDRNADSAIIERLAQKLELHTVEDLKIETIAVRNLVKERGGISAETSQQVIDLLNKFRLLAGMEVTNVVDEPVVPKMLKCPSLVIPHEFLCPITLEVMIDPVIVASGQTYDRESIQKWFDSNHATCPKTRVTLPHLSVAPNYALKNLIQQWCEKNKFKLPVKEPSQDQESSSSEHKEEITTLVEKLSSCQLEVQRKAAMKIRLLSKENPENRILIARSGGIPPLVQLLSYPDSKIQQHAVTALLNLSIDETNKKLITREEAIPAIIEVLKTGSTEARENSAAALFSLSMLDENKVKIGLSDGIPPLVDLLQNGTIRGKKDAATALFNLSLNQANKARAISAGIVPPLLKVLKDRNLGMVDESLSIFLLLASHPDGRQEIGQLSFIETLVDFIREGTPKNKECATSVLLELGSNNSSFLLASLQYGVYEHLVEITKSGTNRAQRKAKALLQLISKCEHI